MDDSLLRTLAAVVVLGSLAGLVLLMLAPMLAPMLHPPTSGLAQRNPPLKDRDAEHDSLARRVITPHEGE